MSNLADLTRQILQFRDERDWKQFHSPKDMTVALSLEAAELLEHMLWKNGRELDDYLEGKRVEVGDELADVLYWTLLIAHDLKIDLTEAFGRKMAENARKYPIERSHGSSRKYTELVADSSLKKD